MTKKSKAKREEHDIDDDPMFDTSEKAKSNALDRRLIQYFERYERLEEEGKGISDDKKDVISEVKGVGYDAKTFRAILKLRKMDPDNRKEMEALLETYKRAVGLD